MAGLESMAGSPEMSYYILACNQRFDFLSSIPILKAGPIFSPILK
jgi:hypothetical protein